MRGPGCFACDERLDHVGIRRIRQHRAAFRLPSVEARFGLRERDLHRRAGILAGQLSELSLAREHPERVLNRGCKAAPGVAATGDRLDSGKRIDCRHPVPFATQRTGNWLAMFSRCRIAEVVLVEFGEIDRRQQRRHSSSRVEVDHPAVGQLQGFVDDRQQRLGGPGLAGVGWHGEQNHVRCSRVRRCEIRRHRGGSGRVRYDLRPRIELDAGHGTAHVVADDDRARYRSVAKCGRKPQPDPAARRWASTPST